jgi:ATP-dependent DNA helicase DinG
MKYEKQILDAFQRLEMKPRDGQVDAVNQIVAAYLDDKAELVILSAPTGTGKSIIGAVVAEVMHSIRYPGVHKNASFLISATNMLLEQYQDTFADPKDPWDDTFVMVNGASNYDCNALSTETETQTAESCSLRLFQKSGMQEVVEKYCNQCAYQTVRKLRDKSRHLIINYAYHFVDRMYMKMLEKRTVCVFDEAHLLNDLFVEHNAIYFSEKRLKSFTDEIAENLQLGHTDVFRSLKELLVALQAGKITEKNYEEFLGSLADVYGQVTEAAQSEAERHLKNPSKYLKLSKMAKKYFNLGCKIGDFFEYSYPHVFEYKALDVKNGQNEHEISVKPIFVGSMFSTLINAEYNLLMSATISEQYAKRTLGLSASDKVKYIKLAPAFPAENKKVVFYKPQALNYNTMKDPQTVKKLCATAYEIANQHTKNGENGLILCPSFVVTQPIAETLRIMRGNYEVFEHKRGEKLADILVQFKKHKGKPAILITPSGYEGMDLAGDLSRWQIITKAPFASLGDKRMKTILDLYPDVYEAITVMKLVQGAGRSVRSADDYATTYMLDTAVQRIWGKGKNPWYDEFETVHASMLT